MAAGGECPALGSLRHRSRLGSAGLPSLSQAWLYLPASPCSPLVPAGARPQPWGAGGRERAGTASARAGGNVARFSTFPCAGACRDGEFWTGRVRMGEKCSVPYSTALSGSFPFWHLNIHTHFHTSHAFAFNMHRISVPFCCQFAACFS